MVEVFKTNIRDGHCTGEIAEVLRAHFPVCKVDFDLEDCDRILRVEAVNVNSSKVIELVKQSGYHCEELSDG
jgi:hypothetical protein